MKKLLITVICLFIVSSCAEIKMLQSDVAKLNEKVNAMSGDIDGDGVADLFDADNKTPKGVAVAGNGIALDSDGDGIPNYKDSDVFTPKGINVDETGMPRDSDMDGVPDHLDEEKNTSFGALVNFKGQTIANSGSLNNSTALLPSIYFKFNSATLSTSSYERLTAVARYLKENPKITLVIRGYSDPMGSESYNKALALRRAKAVKKALNEVFNVKGNRLQTVAIGENDKLSDNYKINRRVDFKLK
ncbi:OmpA family protein [Schleiferiaceae bacterium]|nr:OmpA family protein [Schleiferiaceae bacterium]